MGLALEQAFNHARKKLNKSFQRQKPKTERKRTCRGGLGVAVITIIIIMDIWHA